MLADFPFVAPVSTKSKLLRRIVIVKQITCFYSVNESNHTIVIHLFWNNHKNPKKLTF